MLIMPIKFQKKFDSRTISRELPYKVNCILKDVNVLLL